MHMTPATSPAIAPSLPDEWAERLFARMENVYGQKWADSLGGIPRARVKQAWAEELHGYSGDEIKRGIEACRTKAPKWPPTVLEFAGFCRPVADEKTEWAEAVEQMRIRLEGRGGDAWSRPQVYWAAVAIGWYDLNSTAWEQIKTRWARALENAKADPIPEYRAALPAPGQQTVTREDAVERMDAVRETITAKGMDGTTKAGTSWAYALMQREASGEALVPLAAEAWREVLGFDSGISAKKALASVTPAA